VERIVRHEDGHDEGDADDEGYDQRYLYSHAYVRSSG
jgi:hypothetical protein